MKKKSNSLLNLGKGLVHKKGKKMQTEDVHQTDDDIDNRFFQPKIFKQDTVAEIPDVDSVDSFDEIISEVNSDVLQVDRRESRISDNLNFSNEN